MKKRIIPVGLAVWGMLCGVFAVQPNYVETTTYNVDGSGSNVVATEYSDGLGRSIQSKVQLGAGKDRVVCTFYDDAGRPSIATKPFVDDEYPGVFLPGDLNDAVISEQLKEPYNNDTKAYSQTEYWDDPTGRGKKLIPPGKDNTDKYARSWTFGVDSLFETLSYAISEGNSVTFHAGIITVITHESETGLEGLFEQLYAQFLTANPFTNEGGVPRHFLTVSLDPEGHISEQLNDVFGRTVIQYTGPAINGVAGESITTGYSYDILGNVLEELPPMSGTETELASTLYRYNTLGQVISKKPPDIDGEMVYEYNDDGSLYRETHTADFATLRYLEYEYDDLGRQTAVVQCIPPLSPRAVVEDFYDDAAHIPGDIYNRLSAVHKDSLKNSKGRLVCSIAHNYVNSNIRVINIYSYTDEGQIRYKATIIDGNSIIQTTWYEYDIHGKVIADFCFYGNVVVKKRYEYDNLGRLQKVIHSKMEPDGSISGEPVLVAYGYSDIGDMARKIFNEIDGNYHVSYERNILGQDSLLTTPSNFKGFSEIVEEYSKTGNITRASYSYNFNPATSEPEDHKVFTMTYAYDSLSRLKSVTSNLEPLNYNTQYTYDKIGRFTSKIEGQNTIQDYSYYGSTNRLKQTGRIHNTSHQYVYTREGSLLFDFSKNMMIVYDWRNLPQEFRFFDDLTQAEIKKSQTGTYTMSQLTSMLNQEKIKLVSKVVMLYDADGSRVCKMEVNN